MPPSNLPATRTHRYPGPQRPRITVTAECAPYPTPLPSGTRVIRNGDGPTAGHRGVVQPYMPTAAPALTGLFPVAWRRFAADGSWWDTWETCTATDVAIVIDA